MRWALAGVVSALVVVAAAFVALQVGRTRVSPALAGASSEQVADVTLMREYEEYVRGVDEAIEECEAALAENPRNARVRLAYINARSARLDAMDRFVAGGR